MRMSQRILGIIVAQVVMAVLLVIVWQGEAIIDGTAPPSVLIGVVGSLFLLMVGFWWKVIQSLRRGVNSMAPTEKGSESMDDEFGIDDVMDLGSSD